MGARPPLLTAGATGRLASRMGCKSFIRRNVGRSSSQESISRAAPSLMGPVTCAFRFGCVSRSVSFAGGIAFIHQDRTHLHCTESPHVRANVYVHVTFPLGVHLSSKSLSTGAGQAQCDGQPPHAESTSIDLTCPLVPPGARCEGAVLHDCVALGESVTAPNWAGQSRRRAAAKSCHWAGCSCACRRRR